MPLNLDNSIPVSAVIDALEITSFAVDLDRLEMIVGYTQLADGVRAKDSVAIVSGLDFGAAIARADALANAMPAGEVHVYEAIKCALYEHLMTATGMAGTIA